MRRALLIAALAAALVCAAQAAGSKRLAYTRQQVDEGAVKQAIAFLESAANGTNTTGTGYVMTKKNNAAFLVYTCAGLAKVVNELAAAVKSLTIEVACTAGSIKKDANGAAASWTGVDYNCENIAAYWSPTVKGSKITIKSYVKDKNCGKDERPKFFGGATGNNTYNLPFLVVGTDTAGTEGYASLTLTNVQFDGGNKRPGVSVVSASKASLKGVDIKNCKGYFEGAALEAVDTAVTYTCSKTAPCTVSGNEVVAAPAPSNVAYGGALTIHQDVMAAKFSAKFITFDSNKAAKLGGAYYVFKGFQKSTSVAFSSCTFTNNAAPYGTVGFSWRNDGNPNDPAKGTPAALKLNFASSTATAPSGGNSTGSLMLAGVYQNITFDSSMKPVTMPWNAKLPKGGSWTTASPTKGVLGKGPIVLPSAGGQSAAAWGVVNAFIDYTLA